MKQKNQKMKTQVAIIGGGPAGLLLSQILMRANIATIVLESRSRSYVLNRIRAGVIEHGSMELLCDAGMGERLLKEGIKHSGFIISSENKGFRIDLSLASGKSVYIYGQTEITMDLYKAQEKYSATIFHGVKNVSIQDINTTKPQVYFEISQQPHHISCDYIAGCDGSKGISRSFIPKQKVKIHQSNYPYSWLGILTKTKPVHKELIYANHERGFALASMRNQKLSRYYIQTSKRENISNWPDKKIWEELKKRLPAEFSNIIETGNSVEKSLTTLRSIVFEPMQWERLFLAGDSAHIMPPTGAKGLNLAFSDIFYLSNSLINFYRTGSTQELERYSERALSRVWKTVRFSQWMTSLLHTSKEKNSIEREFQLSELQELSNSESAQKALAENYVGIPY